MAVAFRAAGAVKKNAGSGNMASVALPTGHTTNDILVLVVIAADNVVCSVNQSYTNKVAVNNGTGTRLEVWWKRDGGSEVAPTVTHTGGNDAEAVLLAFSGVDSGLSDPFRDAQTQTGTGTSSGSFTLTMPALTGVVSGDEVIDVPSFAAGDTNGGSIFSTPTGFTSRVTANDDVNGSRVASFAVFTKDASGSQGSSTTSAQWNGTTNPTWIGATLALSSSAGGSGGGRNASGDFFKFIGREP